MADLGFSGKTEDREEKRGRHGRDNRGGNKRRRDDEDDDQYNNRREERGPQRRRRNDGRREDNTPRRRYEEPAFAKARRQILNIASSTKLPQDEAIEIAEFLRDNYDDEQIQAQFFDVFVQLIVDQPFKIPFIAAVAFYGNQIKPEFTVQAIKLVGDRLQEALTAGQWRDFKLLLRFLACLTPIFEEDSIFALLGQLFDTVVDLQSANENDVVGIELVKIILLTIPYAVVSGGSRFHEKAQELLGSTGIVAGNLLPVESLIHPYDAESEDKVMDYNSVISLLQQQLTKEADSGWKVACIPKFHADALKRKNPEDDTLPAVSPMHTFPTLTIPSPVNPGPKPLFPEAYFSLFASQEILTVPTIDNIAASLIRDAIVDTIDQLDFNRDVVAKFLVDLDCYWSLDTFAKRGTALDKFREETEKTVYKPEDMVIDAIFSLLFKLPTPEHKLVYYHCLITQCCKVAPAAVAPSLGRGIRTIYKSLHAMDLELCHRFLDWFSHHLSNFEFRWRWTEWLEDLKLSNLEPKKAFIIAALDKEIRLSFAKRIRSTLPEDMHSLIPQRLDEDNSPDFKYDKPETPYASEGQMLLLQLRKKATHDEVQVTIDKIHTQAKEAGIEDILVPSTDAFVTAICRLGAKSLSHFLSCVERGRERLLNIAQESDTARRQIVASVVEYWKDQPGIAVRIIDLLLNYTILAPITVVQWVFGDYMGAGEALTESWVFEMVSNTVTKVSNRNRQIASARLQKGLPAEQLEMVEGTLIKDRDNARELFKYIEDAVGGVAQGSSDVLIEKETNGELSEEDGKLLRAWGKRWHAVFVRQSAVEESIVGESALEARIKFLAAQPDPEPEADAMKVDDETNGATEANGDTIME
ncbi:hypothetical protein P280DRAFT_430508 [Massarina eburnea CBS 473.64]|uniref:Cap binding protein n=1 Tax=Massarina eburnea CBS 473.64 TaxID=1395130 RepID=A0A6A6RUT4_9PLEO|nr:hypothetical protein P280DRAFT_430508 [Massarina eburnea CBS 473.64]